jgi:hypothetical protein
VISVRRLSTILEAAVAGLVIVLLTRPMIFGGSDRGVDFYTHYWYVLHQSEALRHGGPSLYLHDSTAVYSPLYAFYGGTLYVVTGALAILLGSTLHAYVLSYALGFAAAYGGWWWMARQAGLSRVAAHVPGLLFVTSAYAISLLYVRGDWPEHISVSMLPLLVASGVGVLRADRLRLLPAAALTISSVLFFGSHNLTLLCGSVVLVSVALLLLLGVPQARRMVSGRGVLRLAAIVVPALLVNAWFLVPDLTYQARTNMVMQKGLWRLFLEHYSSYLSTSNLFSVGRPTADPAVPHFAFALPVLAIAWVVVATVVTRPRMRDPWLRVGLLLAGVMTALVLAMTHVEVLQGPFVMMQFSYRLESYVNLVFCGIVLTCLVLLKQRSTSAGAVCRWALAPIVAISVALALWQSDVHRDPASYGEWHAFPSFYTAAAPVGLSGYAEGKAAPVMATEVSLPDLSFPPSGIQDGRVSATVRARPGSYVQTNLAGVWSLARLRGARYVAVSTTGRSVVQIDPASTSDVNTITVEEARPPAVRIGAILSLIGIAGLMANFVVIGLGWWRRRTHGPSMAEPSEVPSAEPVAV